MKYRLITDESFIKRAIVIRYTTSAMRHHGPQETSAYTLKEFQQWRKGQLRNVKILKLTRFWTVCVAEPTTFYGLRIVQRWERIEMARAHRDGRNFHYAKWLLEKDSFDKDLTGR